MSSYISNVDVKQYLFDYLKTDHIKNIDTIVDDINTFKICNYNISNKEKIAQDTERLFKYINYIPIQLVNESTKEVLIVLQQSVSKNTYKIRKSQTYEDFNKNLDEYLNKFKGPERDSIDKLKQFDLSDLSGNYNIPNHTMLYDYLKGIENQDDYLMDTYYNDISKLEKLEDIFIKKIINVVIFNKIYRTKLITQMEYYYYYRNYDDCKKLANVVVILYKWYIKNELLLQNRLHDISLENEDIEDTNSKSISFGLSKEIESIEKLIKKCENKSNHKTH